MLHLDDAGGPSERGRYAANPTSDGGGLFCPFFQIDAMVLPISPIQIALGSCACTQIEALEKRNWWLYPDDAGDLSERGRNAANLISDGGGLFCPCYSNWCHGSANISRTNQARKLRLRTN